MWTLSWAPMWAPGCEDEEGPLPAGPGDVGAQRFPCTGPFVLGRVGEGGEQHLTARRSGKVMLDMSLEGWTRGFQKRGGSILTRGNSINQREGIQRPRDRFRGA